jgi:murein L,D-transpeptidase YafK
MMKTLLFLFILCSPVVLTAQTAAPAFNFIEYQRSFPRISDALQRREDSLERQFRAKKLRWPVKNIYIRSFKYDSRLEVWVRYSSDEKYQLFKNYKVCALAGTLGPKRMQGDYQVPEGFYYINEFNPRSNFHLSLGLNYPNSADRILGDSLQPGGDIYIHGKCVTSGCIPIMDQQIEELYILAAHAHAQGQDFIPVHIFPVDFANERSAAYLSRHVKQFPEYTNLTRQLRNAYMYFEKTKKLPIILTGDRGQYILANTEHAKESDSELLVATKRERRPVKTFNESELGNVVDKLPSFPGGIEGFQQFLNTTSKNLSKYLDAGQLKTYVMIEFIIDKDGKPAYAKVLRGGNDELNDRLQEMFETMPDWTPATRQGKNVAIKLKQSLEIVR